MFRDALFKAYRLHTMSMLVERRPRVYGGLTDIHMKAHQKILKLLPSYESVVLVRIWSGCPMTKSHKFTLKEVESPMCECGEAAQDIPHLLFSCPLTRSDLPLSLSGLSLPPCASSALLFPSFLHLDLFALWVEVCRKAIAIISAKHVQNEHWDTKGHLVTLESTLQYAYCARCHITRRARDIKWIASQECSSPNACACTEGDYRFFDDHCVRLEMGTRKLGVLKPRYTCIKVGCGMRWWATGAPRGVCIGTL